VLEAHKGILYKIAISYCARKEDRADMVQEMVLQLWKSFTRYNDRYQYSTWVYRIALNVAISFYRKEKRRLPVLPILNDGLLSMCGEDEVGEQEEQLARLQKFIGELPLLDRALMLLYLEEKSQREMADIMGLTETNVATKISRIKKILRQKFESVENQ
jgi:RNA polymerase sigma factor (sigma-70 family)